jgi:uncharacterized protein (TIGR03905 family)
MKHITFRPNNTCSQQIDFDLTDDKKIINLQFLGGCSGNLKAISILVNNQNAMKIAQMLQGNRCGLKSTSCADQLAIAIKEACHD